MQAGTFSLLQAQMFLQSLRETERLAPELLARLAESLLRQNMQGSSMAASSPREMAMKHASATADFWRAWNEIPVASLNGVDLGGGRPALSRFADACMFEYLLEYYGVPLNGTLLDATPGSELVASPWSSTFPDAGYACVPHDWPPKLLLQAVRSRAASILRAAPDTLLLLEKSLAATPHELSRLRAVISIGAPISNDALQRLCTRFSCPVVAMWYEPAFGIVAHRGEGGAPWLLSDATHVIQVTDSGGRRAVHGGRGNVAMSALYNMTISTLRVRSAYSALSVVMPNGRVALQDITPV